MKKRLYRYSLITVVLLLIGEIVLRIYPGVGERPLYEVDSFCEYKLQPNQNISRFRNSYQTNSYGMRSGKVSDKNKKNVLLFGDSVINGGTRVDQKDLSSEILKEKLSEFFQNQVGVHNISAGSWGPENAYRYFEQYVDFDFDMIVMAFSSHDYNDNMHFRSVVGQEPAWPNEQPLSAITDVFSNFLYPKIKSMMGDKYDYLDGFDDSAVNPGWDLFINYCTVNNVPLLVYVHPEASEISNGAFDQSGKDLINKLKNQKVSFVNGMDTEQKGNYIDNIHMNSNGHKLLAETLYNEIIKVSF